jgi:SRSO17 transposase
MEERFEVRLEEMVGQAQVSPGALHGAPTRLAEFIAPFAALLAGAEQGEHVGEYIAGLLSKLKRKTGEAIAYLHDKGRQAIQKFIGLDSWDHRPLVLELGRQVGREIGERDGVIVFDPSGFEKKGTDSVGVARQWCGRSGKITNCQVGIYTGYVTRKEHALVDMRLYLPKEWTTDRKRCRKAGVPKGTKFKTRHALALDMLDEQGPQLPHQWIAGDDEMGRSSWFRGKLRERGEQYLLDVPSNTLIRDLEAEPPEYSGRGPYPKRRFERADQWMKALPESAWTKITVRDAEKGPLEVEAVQRRVEAKSGAKSEEVLLVTRERQAGGTYKHDYHLSNAPFGTPLAELVRVSSAEHRIEECLERAKGEAGLADYQVRNWKAWHHHQTLSLIAAWFLVEETRRGKNPDARADGPARRRHDREPARTPLEHEHPRSHQPPHDALA